MREESHRFDLPGGGQGAARILHYGADRPDGPVVSVSAGPRAGDFNGAYIVWRLTRLLEDVSDGLAPGLKLRGGLRIVSFPLPAAGTTAGREEESPGDGLSDGAASSSAAAAVAEALREPGGDHFVEIRSSDLLTKECPQVRIFDESAPCADLARAFGLDVVWTHPLAPGREGSLAYRILQEGVPAFTIVLGTAGRLNRFYADLTFRGLLQFLISVGALAGRSPFSPPGGRNIRIDSDRVVEVVAETAGLFAIENELGTRVEAGELIGRLLDVAGSRPPADVAAPCGGFLFTVRAHPAVRAGSLLARIALEER